MGSARVNLGTPEAFLVRSMLLASGRKAGSPVLHIGAFHVLRLRWTPAKGYSVGVDGCYLAFKWREFTPCKTDVRTVDVDSTNTYRTPSQ